MAGSALQVFLRVFRPHSASQLQASGICFQRFQRLFFRGLKIRRIRRVEKDHMSSFQARVTVHCRIKSRVLAGHKILLRLISRVFQASSHDLFYFSVMYVDTRPKFHTATSFCL